MRTWVEILYNVNTTVINKYLFTWREAIGYNKWLDTTFDTYYVHMVKFDSGAT